jgi:ketosteroid isomerase-like protein
MSEQDVETIRRLIAVFNEAPEKVDAWLSFFHPDAEFQAPPEWPEARSYRGHEEIAQLADAWFGSFDEYRWDEEEIIDADDCVVALFHHRGRMGNQWVEREIGSVYYLRDAKVERVVTYFNWDEAFETAGLTPESSRDSA